MSVPLFPSLRPEVISLGCRMNLSESEALRVLLAEGGDIVVVNSCAVTGEALRQTRQAIRRARRARPQARLLVTGCAAEIDRAALAAMPEVDGLVANDVKLDARAWNIPASQHLPATLEPGVERASAHTRAFVAVQNGCDHACSFCIIPAARGPSRSRGITDVVAEVGNLVDSGVREIVLTGVDLTSWGLDLDGGPGFADRPRLGTLVSAILAAHGLARLRLSSLDGIEIDDNLFDLLASEPRVMPHLHLSLQHGADLILKRMKRRHRRADAMALVERLKARRADLAVGADLIAGFPTETYEHHTANLSLIAELDIVHGHIFPYSSRPGTPAALMPQITAPVIAERAAALRSQVAFVRARWLESLIGSELTVLAERDGTGHATNFARVALPVGTQPGTLLTINPTRIERGLLV